MTMLVSLKITRKIMRIYKKQILIQFSLLLKMIFYKHVRGFTVIKNILKIIIKKKIMINTLKNVIVDPLSRVPYEISVWPARSSGFSMGVIILSTVRNAAKFAVYEVIIIRVKNHQIPPTIRVDVACLIIRIYFNKRVKVMFSAIPQCNLFLT